MNLKLAIKLAIVLFSIGTAIFILFCFTGSTKVAAGGYAFLVTSIVISWAFIALVLINFLRRKIAMAEALKILGVILANIPIAILYTYLVTLLFGYARITFSNTTSHDLRSIQIHGCEEKEIAELKQGDSKTVWIRIPGDCSIDIEYESGGEKKSESVAGYLTHHGGVKAVYEIGSNRDIFQ
ncbi:MAG TPA: hypothetical protein VGK59_00815 [Ohtaekwangia sp.]